MFKGDAQGSQGVAIVRGGLWLEGEVLRGVQDILAAWEDSPDARQQIRRTNADGDIIPKRAGQDIWPSFWG